MPAKKVPMRKIKDVLRLRWGLGLTVFSQGKIPGKIV